METNTKSHFLSSLTYFHSGEHWSQEACDVFEKLSCCAQWKVLMARVVYYDDSGVPCVELIDTNSEEVSCYTCFKY